MKWFGWFLTGVALALGLIGELAVRIANPDKTETRLFLDYWWYWILTMLVMFAALTVLRLAEARPEPRRAHERRSEAP